MSRASRAAKQQAAQQRLSVRLARDLARLWRIVRLGAFGSTIPRWVEAVQAAVDEHAAIAGSLAVDYYEGERELARVRGRPFTPTIPAVPPQKVEASLKWATKELWVPQVENPPSIESRLQAAEVKAAGAAQKAVADLGRDVIRDAIFQDRQARGWARVTTADSCAFCALMALRGPVYASESTAGRDANRQFEGEGRYKFHDHCDCTIAPIFNGQEWDPPDHVRQWERLYKDATRGKSDLMGAWRTAYASSKG